MTGDSSSKSDFWYRRNHGPVVEHRPFVEEVEETARAVIDNLSTGQERSRYM